MSQPVTSQSRPKKTQAEKVLDYILETVLFPYQRDWVLDQSRFKVCLKARQIGISLAIGFEGLLDVLQGKPVYYVSRTEKQSIYLLDKFYKWADYCIACGLPLRFDVRTRTEAKVNGVDIKSLTSHASGDEGFTGNVYLDEFALHEDAKRIYRSLYPTITWGYNIRIVSRSFGQSGLFYELWTNADKYPDYSRHKIDIDKAIGDGLVIDREGLKAGIDDEGFRENYLCEFIDESTAFFPYELLRSCIGETSSGGGTCYLGVDIGRKHDRTVLYTLAKLGDKFYTRSIEELKNTSFETQMAAIEATMRREKVQRVCGDSTGMGMQLMENLRRKYPNVEAVHFTNDIKEHLAVTAKRAFENKRVEIPDDMQLISDLHGIKKLVTPSHNVRFDADRTAEGHSDRAWALFLALHAGTVSRATWKVIQ